MSDEEEVYLVNPDGTTPGKTEVTWVKIGDNGTLEFINWETINKYSKEFDDLGPNGRRTQTHVICKLLTLVRDETKREIEEQHGHATKT